MENNPYGYDKRIPQQMPQNRTYANNYPGAYMNQQPGLPPMPRPQQAPARKAQTPRMPKDRALALARLFKKSLVVMSLATFASFSGLVALHQINTTNQKSTSTTTTSSSHEQEHDNGFLNQQGDDNLGNSSATATATTGQPGSTGTSNSGPASGSNPPTSSGPASGTSVS